MRKYISLILGFSFLISGFLISDARALMRLDGLRGQPISDIEGLVVLIHSCHSDCQQGDGGNWHKHKGLKCKKRWCSKPSHSETPPAAPGCGNGACLGAPDRSLINHSPLPDSDNTRQQTH